MMGYRVDNGRQEVISVLFDRDHFDEESAGEWWLRTASRTRASHATPGCGRWRA